MKDRILDLAPPSTSHSTSSTNNSESRPAPPFTLASAFIIHSRVFLKGLRESMATVGCECELRRSPAERLARRRDLLQEMRYMLDDAPGPVRQWASSEQHGEDETNVPVTPRYDNNDEHSVVSSYGSPVAERGRAVGADNTSYSKVVQGQHEIMRANIHVTHLWLQSLLLEQVDVIVQEGVIGNSSVAAGAEEVSASLKANWAEREDICRQMLHLLHSIPYVYLEPNGLYLVSSFITTLPNIGSQRVSVDANRPTCLNPFRHTRSAT